MQIKKYAIASSLLMMLIALTIAIGGDAGPYSVKVFGFAFTFPVVVWVILPMLLLFFASLAHMAYYGTVNYFQKMGDNKDIDLLIDVTVHRLLDNEKSVTCKDGRLQALADLLSKARVETSATDSTLPALRQVLQVRYALSQGDNTDLASWKLPKFNSYVQQNEINQLKNDPHRAESVLKNPEWGTKLLQEATRMVCAYADGKYLLKTPLKLTKEAIFTLAGRMETLNLSDEQMGQMIQKVDFSRRDYLLFAQLLLKHLSPDRAYEMVSYLHRTYANVDEAYLYLLIELEMNDQVDGFFNHYSDDEFFIYRLYRKARAQGEVIKLSTFINQCKN